MLLLTLLMFLLFILSLSLHTVHTDSFTIQIGSFTTVTTITTKSSVHPSLFLPSPCPEHTDSSHCIQLPTLTTHPLSLSPITPFLGSPSLNCAFAVAVHHLSILQSTDHQILNLSSELGSSLVCFDYLFVIHPQHIHPYTPHTTTVAFAPNSAIFLQPNLLLLPPTTKQSINSPSSSSFSSSLTISISRTVFQWAFAADEPHADTMSGSQR